MMHEGKSLLGHDRPESFVVVVGLSRSFPCILWILAYGSFHPCLLDVSLLAMGSYIPWLPHLDHHAYHASYTIDAAYHSPLHPLKVVRGKVSCFLTPHPPLGDKITKASSWKLKCESKQDGLTSQVKIADAAKIWCRWLIVCTFGPIITSGWPEASLKAVLNWCG